MATIKEEPQEATWRPAIRRQSSPISIASSVEPRDVSGLADVEMPTAVHALGEASRLLIESITSLEALNINTALLRTLPRIVVVGDQSAGKSSVIESVCDITLPRSEGTCTRCPFVITTTNSLGKPWSCQVSLVQKYSYLQGRTGDFDNWTNQCGTTTTPFVTVLTKPDLELALRRAQLAILNPHKDPRSFLSVSPGMDSDRTVGFSPNMISLKIMGDNLPELSLHDLPGAINSLGNDEDEYLVEFVENLMKTYMKDDSAIVLLACPANQDMETSTAYRYLKACPGALKRCVGVLTKADLIETSPAKIRNLKDILCGKKFGVGCGWFVTRQLSQIEIDEQVSYEHARGREAAFFKGIPWSSDLKSFGNRFGVPNLQKALSQKLTTNIMEAIPAFRANVHDSIARIEHELSTFAEKPEAQAPHIKVIREIDVIRKALDHELDVDSTSEFRTKYRALFMDFAKQVQDSKPHVVLSTPGHVTPTFEIEDNDEEVMDETPSKVRKTGPSARDMSSTPRPSQATPNSVRKRKVPLGATVPNKVVFHLDKVKAQYDTAPGADMGQQVDTKTNKSLMLEAVNNSWRNKVESLTTRLRVLFVEMLDATIGRVFAHRRSQQLFVETSQIVQALLREGLDDQIALLRHILTCEEYRPITYNTELLKEKKFKYTAQLRKGRQEHRVREYFDNHHKVPSANELEKRFADDEWVRTKLGIDIYDRELEQLPIVLAYYDVAAAQFVDCIAKSFEAMLMSQYQSRFFPKLLEGLRTNDIEYCAQLLAEDPQREQEHVKLLMQHEQLQLARDVLTNLTVGGN